MFFAISVKNQPKIQSCDVTLRRVTTFQKDCCKTISLSVSYLCENMKLPANKLGKLRLFWFSDHSFVQKERFSFSIIRQIPLLKIFFRELGVLNFPKLPKTKKN